MLMHSVHSLSHQPPRTWVSPSNRGRYPPNHSCPDPAHQVACQQQPMGKELWLPTLAQLYLQASFQLRIGHCGRHSCCACAACQVSAHSCCALGWLTTVSPCRYRQAPCQSLISYKCCLALSSMASAKYPPMFYDTHLHMNMTWSVLTSKLSTAVFWLLTAVFWLVVALSRGILMAC